MNFMGNVSSNNAVLVEESEDGTITSLQKQLKK